MVAAVKVPPWPKAAAGHTTRAHHADTRNRPKLRAPARRVACFVSLSLRWLWIAGFFLLACGAPAREAPAVRALPETAAPAPLGMPRIVVTPHDTATLAELLERGHELAREGDLEGAALLFDRVAALEPRGEHAAEASFRAAEAHDALGHHEAALQRYRDVADRHAGHPLARSAALRCVRLLAFLEDFDSAGRFADRLLAHRAELRPIEAIIAYGAKALALVARGDDVRAGTFVARGRDVVERQRLDLAGRVPVELAQLYFAQGEVYRRRAERIQFVPRPEDFAATLERRCQLVLDAQRAYSDTWRAYDAHWSAMAGFRVGELYQRLHEDLMAMGPPPQADTDARKALFDAAMRLRLTVLLEKARGMMDHTIAMAEREGEASGWVERARAARELIRASERREQEGLDRLPYTRQELEQAVEELSRRARKAESQPQPGPGK